MFFNTGLKIFLSTVLSFPQFHEHKKLKRHYADTRRHPHRYESQQSYKRKLFDNKTLSLQERASLMTQLFK